EQVASFVQLPEGDRARLGEGLSFTGQSGLLDCSMLGDRLHSQCAGAGFERPAGLVGRASLGGGGESVIRRAVSGSCTRERSVEEAADLPLGQRVGTALSADESRDGRRGGGIAGRRALRGADLV